MGDYSPKILITGANGMLGRTLLAKLSDFELIATDLPEVDITNAITFDNIVSKHRPDVVIHCAAMTAVDNCESEYDIAYRVNTLGSINVAAACHRYGCRLIAISTDYVFDGKKASPYCEFDHPDPQNIYGKSKYAGEEGIRIHCPNHIIVRISWLYGPDGPSFVHTMLKLANGTRPELKVVNDQIGNPTSTFAVANALHNIILNPEIVGTIHLTCEGEASWFEFAQEIFRLAEKQQKVVPCSSDEFPCPAVRPTNSRLEKRMLKYLGLPAMPDWREALKEFVADEFLNTKISK